MRRLLLSIFLMVFLAGCVVVESPGPPRHGGLPPGQAKKMGLPALVAVAPPPLVVVGPPALVVVGPPRLVLVPGTMVSVLVGVDYDVFVVGGVYYYFHESVWYTGKSHQGPWAVVADKDLPPGLHGKSPKELKGFKGMVKGHGKQTKW